MGREEIGRERSREGGEGRKDKYLANIFQMKYKNTNKIRLEVYLHDIALYGK